MLSIKLLSIFGLLLFGDYSSLISKHCHLFTVASCAHKSSISMFYRFIFTIPLTSFLTIPNTYPHIHTHVLFPHFTSDTANSLSLSFCLEVNIHEKFPTNMHFDTIYQYSILLAALSSARATQIATSALSTSAPIQTSTSPVTQISSGSVSLTTGTPSLPGSQGSLTSASVLSAWSPPTSPSYCTSTAVHPLKPLASGQTASQPPQAKVSDGYGWDRLTSLFPQPAKGYGWQSEEGYKWGQVVIHNNCNETFNLTSVGAWKLGGPKIRTTYGGLGSPCDDIQHVLKAGEQHREFFRITCSTPKNATYPNDQYCADDDKLSGQAISIKITSNTQKNAGQTQFEYALFQDPRRGDSFKRLNYDISLLDCGNNGKITDAGSSKSEHDDKIQSCPGYRDGVAVTFPHAGGDTSNCPPIFCDGKDKCDMIYTWDRTRQGEASLACEKEYKGEMRVDLCVGRNPEQKR